LWSQASNLSANLEDLRKVDPQLAEDLDRAGRALNQSCFRDPKNMLSEVEARLYRRTAEKWEELVCRARELPGFDDFLRPLPISKLRQAASCGPVIIVNISNYRSDVLIMPPHGELTLLKLSDDIAAHFKNLTEQQQQVLASGRARFGHPWVDNTGSPDGVGSQNDQFQEVLYTTWTLFGQPIIGKLEDLGVLGSGPSSTCRVWWCVTSRLTFVPIHASLPPPVKAGQQSVGMMDVVVSSYTPTVSALVRAQGHKLSQPFCMLAIGQPESLKHGFLPGVTAEMKVLRDSFSNGKATFLEKSAANVDAVIQALPTCSWAHFACHGIQDHNQPLESGLLLHNDLRLTLSRLAQCPLGSAEFAFLSSCESAAGSKLLPNESVHLAAGLQFLGFRGVIGTMWSVNDEDALDVAKIVYEQLLKDSVVRPNASDAALALHRAVRYLRDEREVPLSRWLPFVHFGF
jgi:CHAT domain